MDCSMMTMNGMGWMMWGGGLLLLLVVIVLILSAAALVKYLRSDRRSTSRPES
jgi:uncharacterized integral membrane protein